MFRVKICGVTNVSDAQSVAVAGADAVGFNFYPESCRHISLDVAEKIVATLPSGLQRVGLFVNATDDEICRIFDHLSLDFIQLHGDEPPEFLLSLGGRPIIRAFRLGPGGLAPIREYLDACQGSEIDLCAVLIDAYHPTRYGGTGEVADWERLGAERSLLNDLPLILAGGLNCENVAAAIHRIRPDAIDTASGVEKSPGQKDPVLVQEFVTAARAAWASKR